MSDLTREDEWLSKAFSLEPVVDDGFSTAVMKRVRRKAWARRWTMPIATVIAAVVAAKPAIDLLLFVNNLFGKVLSQTELLSLPSGWVAQSATYMIAGALIVFGGVFMNALQD